MGVVMNKDVQTRWVEALRSDKYKQGRTYLRDKRERFCCLGVLCDLYDPNGWVDGNEAEGIYQYDDDFERRRSIPPMKVQDWAKIQFNGGIISRLVKMNDEGKSFGEIAEYIEGIK
jgi:hypothetical protein